MDTFHAYVLWGVMGNTFSAFMNTYSDFLLYLHVAIYLFLTVKIPNTVYCSMLFV